MNGALDGIRVLDLSRVLAGPSCTQLLGDYGADVFKVEQPGRGDETRRWGPPFLRDAQGHELDVASYFASANRNKRSITVDFSRPDGRALLLALLERCDVLVENFRPGTLAKYGLDYPSVSTLLPRLVYCSITGYGPDGPYAERPGYDFTIQALGGLMSITGAPDGSPTKVGVAVADLFAGAHAAVGILAALRHRDLTGLGQHVQVALLDAQVAMLANQATGFLADGAVPQRLGNAHPSIVPYEAFHLVDGMVVIAVGTDRQFRALCEVVGLPALADELRFATNTARVEHRAALVSLLASVLAGRSSGPLLDELAKAHVPAAPVNDLARVFADAQVRARGLVVEQRDATGAPVRSLAAPATLSRTPAVYARTPPTLGQHTEEVLRELLGLSPDELQRLHGARVI